MLLYQRIEYLLLHLDFIDSHFDELTPITRRMYAIGLANELYQLATQLKGVDEQIETTLGFEDAYLSISTLNNRSISFSNLRNEYFYREDVNNDADINKLIDIFPLNKEDYSFNSENAEIFKTGLRYLCSEANISSRDLVYALENNLKTIFSLLASISRKKSNVKDYQWEEFWYTFLYRDDDLFSECAIHDYERWKEEHDYQDIQVLKDKRTQEILKLLSSGIFSYDVKPVKREMDNCVIDISEDALEEGTELPEDIKTECARFSKYTYYKEDILCLDYVKLGKYIYKHYRDIKDKQGDSLIYFDYMLLHIHDDMAECNPKLKKHLKFYEDNELEEILNKAIDIINSCNGLLKESVAPDFLSAYLQEAYNGDNKIEVQAKLKGQSRYTIICNMLGMLKSTQKVFRLDTTSADIAKVLSTIIEKPKQDSLKRYIDQGASDLQSKLSRWTTNYVLQELGSELDKSFYTVSQQRKG